MDSTRSSPCSTVFIALVHAGSVSVLKNGLHGPAPAVYVLDLWSGCLKESSPPHGRALMLFLSTEPMPVFELAATSVTSSTAPEAITSQTNGGVKHIELVTLAALFSFTSQRSSIKCCVLSPVPVFLMTFGIPQSSHGGTVHLRHVTEAQLPRSTSGCSGPAAHLSRSPGSTATASMQRLASAKPTE